MRITHIWPPSRRDGVHGRCESLHLHLSHTLPRRTGLTDTSRMTSLIPDTMQKVQHAVLGPRESDKLADLKQETKEMTAKGRLTTDYGVKQSTADDWLRVASRDKTGPMLLEDPFARERVGDFCSWSGALAPTTPPPRSRRAVAMLTHRALHRSRGSTTRGSPSGWCTRGAAGRLASSACSRAPRT